MKYNELDKKSAKDLNSLAKELQTEMFHLRIKNKTGQLEKKHQISNIRKDIARIQTKLSELNRSAK